MKINENTIFYALLKVNHLPIPTAEYRFFPERRWRFDYAWPAFYVALEVEGGLWKYGRHNRPLGYIKDMEKYNQATWDGWRIWHCLPNQLCSVSTINALIKLLGVK